MLLTGPVLGHAGSWDEILLFGAPVVGVLLWVRWAERRARARRDAAVSEVPASGDEPPQT